MEEKAKIKEVLLKGILNVVAVYLVILALFNIIFLILRNEGYPLIIYAYTILQSIGYLYIVILLKKIITAVLGGKPFKKENAIGFKRIGYCTIFIGIVDRMGLYIIKRIAPEQVLIANVDGIMNKFFITYLFLGGMALILADVFRIASELKDESDLTV